MPETGLDRIPEILAILTETDRLAPHLTTISAQQASRPGGRPTSVKTTVWIEAE
ncbi:hypothetical protein INS49_015283 [Diaporthe citri]|uniref:uncharacterized protein n=1 Tax=Diaporthe citri TaxID=83186 RepID=UPI001C825BB8|nr:uncharacterized protein INS49_015283 [Diaporthe citri]KAG6355899.1 hypothetical protein INS49_015283 [Diaporthe citri]